MKHCSRSLGLRYCVRTDAYETELVGIISSPDRAFAHPAQLDATL